MQMELFCVGTNKHRVFSCVWGGTEYKRITSNFSERGRGGEEEWRESTETEWVLESEGENEAESEAMAAQITHQ